MFGVDDLRKTRFAQELKQEGIVEGKLQTIPRLLGKNLSLKKLRKF